MRGPSQPVFINAQENGMRLSTRSPKLSAIEPKSGICLCSRFAAQPAESLRQNSARAHRGPSTRRSTDGWTGLERGLLMSDRRRSSGRHNCRPPSAEGVDFGELFNPNWSTNSRRASCATGSTTCSVPVVFSRESEAGCGAVYMHPTRRFSAPSVAIFRTFEYW